MHSRYRISNSSDAFNLDLGVPAIQKLNSEKHTEEVRIYCEPTVECQRVKNLDENRLSSTTETLIVEPHFINLLFTPLTNEFLAQEKKRKVKTEGGHISNNNEICQIKVKDESKPVSLSKLERLKSLDKKSTKENVKDEKVKMKEPSGKKPPDLFSPSAASKSFNLPKLAQLPRTPIPASELPPNSVRMPPKALSSVIPAALSSLSPIPLKDLNKPGGLPQVSSGTGLPPPPQTTSITTSGGLISIQVPLKGADGTTIMQTINVPKSVLAGASERPVLLTVTPKNGINKGQKQIVMLTKNASGFGVSMRTLQPGESPSKVMLSQRPGLPGSGAGGGAGPPASTTSTFMGTSGGRLINQQVSAPTVGGATANKPPDINALLSQVKPVPTKELANKVASNVYPGVNTKSVISVVSSPAGSGGTGTPVSSPLTPQPRAIYLQQQAQTSIGTAGRQTTISQASPQTSTSRTIVNRQVIQQLIRPGGQLIGNGQQLILQDGKRVILQQAPRPSSLDQVPGAGRIVLTQKGQVLQGAQAQALAGKIINTSQGQFIVGPNGQLQKLVQNNMNSQTVRYITISQPNSISGSNLQQVSGSSQLINTSVQNIVAGGSPGQVYGLPSQQVPVSLQLGGVIQQSQLQVVQQARLPGVQQARLQGVQHGQLQNVQQVRMPGVQPGQLPGVHTFTSMGSQGAAINEGLGSRISQLAGVQGVGGSRSTAVLVPVGSGANLGQKIFTTQAKTSQMTTTTASSIPNRGPASSTPGRVTVAIPIMQGGANSPVIGGGTTMLLNTPSPSSLPGTSRLPGSGATGTTIMTQLGTGTSPVSLISSPAGTSPVSSTGVRNLITGPVGSPSIPLSSLGPGIAGLPGSGGLSGSASNQKSTSAFNQMFLNALSNRGLLSQQNGKFVYVGDKSKTVISQGQSPLSSVPIPVTNILNSPGVAPNSGIPGSGGIPGGASPNMLTTPPTVSIKPTDVTPDKNIVQVVVSAPNLDSFTASPRLLRMASSLMENPTIAELINTPCENSDSMTQNLNGDINLYGVKPLQPQGQSPAICDTSAWGGGINSTPTTTKPKMTKPRTFYYRDPRLPAGWYVSVDIIPGSAIITNYFTSNGEKLRSLSEVAHYLKNKLVLLPSCKAIRQPKPLKDMPQLQDLSPENKACVKELILPVVDETSPLIRQIETEIITSMGQPNHLKRSGSNLPNQVEHKKSKIVFL